MFYRNEQKIRRWDSVASHLGLCGLSYVSHLESPRRICGLKIF